MSGKAQYIYYLSRSVRRQALQRIKTDPERIMKMIEEHNRKHNNLQGPRKGWQAVAAVWVKKWHIDRGDVKVGLHTSKKQFHVLESLLPKYVVPDLDGFKLKPYVSDAEPVVSR